MRLGIIGPLRGDLSCLASAAKTLVEHANVERVIYLGNDDALDQVIASWAGELVGANPVEDVLFARAAVACVNADADAIEGFVSSEHARRKLRAFKSVPAHDGKTVELIDGRIAVFVHDKSTLDEDDIAGASLLVFGRTELPVFHRVGSRTFVSPGELTDGASLSGLAVIDDEHHVRVEFMTGSGTAFRTERLDPKPSSMGRMRVQ